MRTSNVERRTSNVEVKKGVITRLLRVLFGPPLTPLANSIRQLNKFGVIFVTDGRAEQLKIVAGKEGMPLQFDRRPGCRLVRVSFSGINP